VQQSDQLVGCGDGQQCYNDITETLFDRASGHVQEDFYLTDEIAYYREHYERSGMADVVIMPYLDLGTCSCLSTKHLQELKNIMETMLQHKPFEIVTVHDDFRAHPNNINYLRAHYRDILAELAEGNLLDDVLSQVNGFQGHFPKKSTNLGSVIRQSNYALC
jgi:hypothetical protein